MSENNFLKFDSYMHNSPETLKSNDVWVRKDAIKVISAHPTIPHACTVLYLDNGKEIIVEGDVKIIVDQIESVD